MSDDKVQRYRAGTYFNTLSEQENADGLFVLYTEYKRLASRVQELEEVAEAMELLSKRMSKNLVGAHIKMYDSDYVRMCETLKKARMIDG